ncbi:hypothetical protein Dsin_014641 [Dipteronia sinensis]|uniref:Uncharacterized protein n=1 Tax=Dipteronia sinensis TaxID=43782 RepID=A0AAE0EA34_9ROSI|nr:hypothetical protein Dsin_014641 [Dipteronia sinensis]
MVITGASSGIGSETARVLALRGVHVTMAVRNMAAGRDVKEAIVKEIAGAKVDVMELDLCSMASIRKFASEFNTKSLPLNLLVNNAGIMATPFTLSKDNIEVQFATNHLGHFLLTSLLMETMKKTAKESGREGRIVNVSSDGHQLAYREGIRFDKINDQSGYSSFGAYGQSKLANILHANELAKRFKEDNVNITVNSLHPGVIDTSLFRYNGIINGASSGIGTETARVLALRGVHVIMAVRNTAAGRDIKDAIVKEIPGAKVDVMELDLASMASVRQFASDFNSQGLPLNLLINNAAVMATPFMLSKDNIELQFATNHIGHFLLTSLLLDNMKKTARESSREGRIVNVSSEGHKLSYREGIRFDKINDQSGYSGFVAYGQSKLANILHAKELAKQFKEAEVNITANSLHPGAIATNLTRYNSILDGFVRMIGRFVLKNVQQFPVK